MSDRPVRPANGGGPVGAVTGGEPVVPPAGSEPAAIPAAGSGPTVFPAAGGEPVVRIVGLRKSFGPVVALAGIDLELRRGETLALLGPSGCGKTTLLRTVAGLERPDAGTIEIGGELVVGPGRSLPPERRRLGMVFQDVALFPHLSVAENVAYGIRRAPDRDARVTELLELVGLPDAGARRPHELSGGMQQRVALARALAPRPAVVLLDEPFANLDLTLRTQLRGELRRVLDATGSSALLVTHDQAEALTLADRVAVMRQGAIDQVDSPERVYAVPATPFVATFVGVANLVRAEVAGGVAQTPLGPVRLLAGPSAGRALVVIRPEHVDLEPAAIEAGGGFAVDPGGSGAGPGSAAAAGLGGSAAGAGAGSAAGAGAGSGAGPGGSGAGLGLAAGPGSAAATGSAAVPATPGVRGRIDARRFAGAELHYEIVLDDGLRVWVEAGAAARHLTVGDEVVLLMRPIETVAFAAGGDRVA